MVIIVKKFTPAITIKKVKRACQMLKKIEVKERMNPSTKMIKIAKRMVNRVDVISGNNTISRMEEPSQEKMIMKCVSMDWTRYFLKKNFRNGFSSSSKGPVKAKVIWCNFIS
jgi:hypothetical protein